MDASLVYSLVREISIHPEYERRKRKYADDLHHIICSVGAVRETTMSGLMETLEYVSYCVLGTYGFSTPWYTCERFDAYYPLRIQALDLCFRREHQPRNSNTLGGFRV